MTGFPFAPYVVEEGDRFLDDDDGLVRPFRLSPTKADVLRLK